MDYLSESLKQPFKLGEVGDMMDSFQVRKLGLVC